MMGDSEPMAEPLPTELLKEYQWKGPTGPFSLALAPGVFAPTHTSRVLAETLEIRPGEKVFDVGCGSGILSFVAARMGAGHVYGVDIVPEAIEVARGNADRLQLADRTDFRAGNLFDPFPDVVADVIIGDVSGIPDEIALESGWFPGGHAGGPTGAEVPVAMIEASAERLVSGGRMYLPTGTIQWEERVLEAARRVFGAANLERLAQREFPLPGLLSRSKALARMMTEGLVTLRQRGSRLLWRLAIWRCIRP
jgi:16S rRNA G1207 methylase RsmC